MVNRELLDRMALLERLEIRVLVENKVLSVQPVLRARRDLE